MSVSVSNFLGLELSLAPKPSFFNNTHIINSFPFTEFLSPTPTSLFPLSKHTSNSNSSYKRRSITTHSFKSHTAHLNSTSTTSVQDSDIATAQVEEQVEVEVAEGYTLTQFIDKIIEVFLKEKPQSKEWRKYLVFREEWEKYRETFYNRCRSRADAEGDPTMKQKLISLGRKVKKIDDEMEGHSELLKEIQDSPTDINAIVARRRKDFTGEFFRYLTLLSETYDSLEDRDAVARLGARCLSAVSAYDNTLDYVDTLEVAQAKFDDILDSPSVDVACEKIKSLAKTKELDSSLILLINSACASAKESTTMKDEVWMNGWQPFIEDIPLDGPEGSLPKLLMHHKMHMHKQGGRDLNCHKVKDIMYRLYKATKNSLRSIAPKEIKLLKHLLNITDPEERFSALATAFSPGDEHEAKDPNALYTTPKELHKWIKIMLDAYNLSKEDTDIREVKHLTQPVVIQRLFILKETIEEEYLESSRFQDSKTEGATKSEEL